VQKVCDGKLNLIFVVLFYYMVHSVIWTSKWSAPCRPTKLPLSKLRGPNQ